MTLADIKTLIDTYLPDNTTGLITPSGQRIVLKTLADFIVSSQGEVETTTFVYDPAFTYDADDPVIYDGSWYLSLVGSNLNNQPDDSPSEWDPVNAYNTVISIYEADSVYLGELTIVINDDKLYLLDRDTVGADPYVSTDFATELSAGDWINLLPNTKPVANTYANDAAMIAAQGAQVEGYFYFAGATLYVYLGTTAGDITDYVVVGGGAQTLAEVLDLGNTSGPNDIEFDTGQGLIFANTSRLREGTIDAGLGGTKGIAQICAVGYELKWEAGRLYVMNGDGTGIRWSLYNFTTTPTIDDDSTKGYGIGSRWVLDDGTVYACSDATTGAAVWGQASEYDDFVASTGNILFDAPRKYGFTTAVTANLTVGITGAKEKNLAKVLHNHTSAPTISVPGGVTLIKDGGAYVVSTNNIYYFVCHKNDAGTVTHISYTITNNQP